MSFFQNDIRTVFSTKKPPSLQSPILICGFPGSGYVGKIAVDHVISELHAPNTWQIFIHPLFLRRS